MARVRDITDIALPPEVIEAIGSGKPLQGNDLESVAQILLKKRDEAIAHRVASGVDQTFLLSEEAYIGIDDMNRAEYLAGQWIKPTTLNAPVTTDTNNRNKVVNTKRSTAFVRLTSRYVDAGAAKVCEILLPPNDKAFSIDPEPVPALIDAQHDMSPAMGTDGKPLMRTARPDEMHPLAVPYGAPLVINQTPASTQPMAPGQQQVPVTKGDQAVQQMQKARECARRAEQQIWSWMVGCSHNRETRKVIFDAARLGVGVLKFTPESRKSLAAVASTDGKVDISILNEVFPADCWVDAWNIFPDPGCGESIRNGDYVWERGFLSGMQVEKLRGLPGYLDSQIQKVLEAGPAKTRKHMATRKPSDRDQMKQDYEIWYYHGALRRTDFAAINPQAVQGMDKKRESVFAIVTMIEETPVKGVLSPLESGEIPYLNVPWQRRPGSWVGIGIPEQIQVPQRIVNAATRAWLNNAGISAGPQIIMNKEGVVPANGEWELTPNKLWWATNDGIIDDVRKAFFSFDVTNVGKQLGEIVQYGMRLAEESTNIPLVTQGQSGETTPETLGATQLQNNNANQLLRDIGYQFDDFITEPLVKMYYECLLLDPEIEPELKGPFRINAHGSASLVERAIQDQTIAQLGTLTLNPVYKIDPAKWFSMVLRSKRLNPEDLQYTPEQQKKIDSTPPTPPPQVQVAMIKSQVQLKQMELERQRMADEHQLEIQIAQIEAHADILAERIRSETQQLKSKLDTDRDAVYVQSEIKRIQTDYHLKMLELQMKKELAIMDYASKHQQSLEQVKAKLADTAMKLRVQKELAATEHSVDLHKHHNPSGDALLSTMPPPTQVPGKAENGKAFQQI